MIETIHNWSIKYKISLNPRKSAIVKFTNRSKLDKQIYKHQFIDSQGENQQYCINYQNKYKYMGIEIDRNLNLKDHYKKINEASEDFKRFIKKLNYSKISLGVRRNLWETFFRSIL